MKFSDQTLLSTLFLTLNLLSVSCGSSDQEHDKGASQVTVPVTRTILATPSQIDTIPALPCASESVSSPFANKVSKQAPRDVEAHRPPSIHDPRRTNPTELDAEDLTSETMDDQGVRITADTAISDNNNRASMEGAVHCK